MKLNKKRISILVSFMCLLILLVFTLCSFDLPSYDTPFSELPTFSGLTQNEVQYIFNILSMQATCGQFNSLVPVCLQFTGGKIYGIFTPFDSTFTMSFTTSMDFYYTSSTPFVRIGLSGEGFSIYQVYGTSVTLPRNDVFGYRANISSSFILFPNFQYAPGTSVSQDLIDIYNYWNTYANRLVYGGVSSSELESAYIDGYGDGYFDGKDVGYGLGFESGYIEGVTDGFNSGYMEGNTDGFDIGFSEGYETGYSDGYYYGYETGYSEAERETVIRYVEPVELDIPRIINGIGAVPRQVLDGVDFEIFGVPILGVLLSILILTISIFVIRKMK